jgi:hypothetical protein
VLGWFESARRRRATWLRIAALLVALFGLAAQQRVVRAEPVVAASASRIGVAHAPRVESNALCVASSCRVAPTPRFAGVPVLAWFTRDPRVVTLRLLSARAERSQRALASTHFHAKRRIPRMNSEEPPGG